MNTVKKRLENRTNAVIRALDSLGDHNDKGDDYTDEDVDKIQEALQAKVDEQMQRLKKRPDVINFSLSDQDDSSQVVGQ